MQAAEAHYLRPCGSQIWTFRPAGIQSRDWAQASVFLIASGPGLEAACHTSSGEGQLVLFDLGSSTGIRGHGGIQVDLSGIAASG